MKRNSLAALVCLLSASWLSAQSSRVTLHSVSLYELTHKTIKQARQLFVKGTSELRHHHFQSGRVLLQQALTVDPNYFDAQNNLGFALLQLEQQEQAQHAFERAIEIDPMNAVAYTNLSVTALHRNNFSLAEKSATQALRLNPSLPEAKSMLGLALVGQGNWTSRARRLLEDTRNLAASETLLEKWPASGAGVPQVTVVLSTLR